MLFFAHLITDVSQQYCKNCRKFEQVEFVGNLSPFSILPISANFAIIFTMGKN